MTAATPSPIVANGSVATQRPSPASGNAGEGRGPERWTAETEAALVRANHAAECGGDVDDCVFLAEHHAAAVDALRVVADLGLLLPPGGEREPVWRSYDAVTGGSIEAHSLERANELVARDGGRPRPFPQLVVQSATRTTWPDGTIHTGPWLEVTDD